MEYKIHQGLLTGKFLLRFRRYVINVYKICGSLLNRKILQEFFTLVVNQEGFQTGSDKLIDRLLDPAPVRAFVFSMIRLTARKPFI